MSLSKSVLRNCFKTVQQVNFATSLRTFASSPLKTRFAELFPKRNDIIKEIKDKHGEMVLGNCTIEQAYGGMRSVNCMIWETSLLDAQEGIRFRGYSIPECQGKLPKAKGGEEPLPEGLFWLLVTGEIPTQQQVESVTAEWRARSSVPAWVEKMLGDLPAGMHPMTQLSMAVLALQKDSKFAKAYNDGIKKSLYWDYAYEDTMDLLAKLPRVASLIYRNTFKNKKLIDPNPNLDWGANYAHMLGFDDPKFIELIRLYLVIHSDHEGGNVSAHATHLVGSTLADPYLSFSGGMNGLAGPLHGLANQEVLRWLKGFKAKYLNGKPVNKETVSKAVWDTLNAGQVIPGYGHAVLRKTDPRYMVQREFALKHIHDDEDVRIVEVLYDVVPGILTQHGKTKNPWPNVDAHSGVLLQHYGLVEEDYYTVMFGVSRALGVLASNLWSRALGFPLERPKSFTTESILEIIQKKGGK